MDVSENSGTPKSSILIGFSVINNPFWGTPIFGNTHMVSISLRLNLVKVSQIVWVEFPLSVSESLQELGFTKT